KAGTDGYTVCMCSTSVMYLPAIQDPATPYDPTKVLTPVLHLFDAAALFVARPGLNVSTLREAIAAAKANPGRISFGSIGSGERATYPVVLLGSMTGVEFNNVLYKGELPVVTDVLADRVDLGYVGITNAMPQIRAGKLKPLATITSGRLSSL